MANPRTERRREYPHYPELFPFASEGSGRPIPTRWERTLDLTVELGPDETCRPERGVDPFVCEERWVRRFDRNGVTGLCSGCAVAVLSEEYV